MPYSTAIFARWIPHQEGQTVSNISASIEDGNTISAMSLTNVNTSSPTNTAAKFRSSPSNTSKTVVLQYKMDSGVTLFRKCNGEGFPDTALPTGFFPMIAKWAMGGLSVATVKTLEVTFNFAHTSLHYLDSPAKHPSDFKDTVTIRRDEEDGPITVTHRGTARSFLPGEFFYYLRFGLLHGRLVCPTPRDCASERSTLSEGVSRGLRREQVVGIAVGLAAAGTAVVVGVLIYVCRRRRVSQLVADDGQSSMRSAIPTSLKHFAYDTGDADAGMTRKWETYGVTKVAEEVCASDLSPRKR